MMGASLGSLLLLLCQQVGFAAEVHSSMKEAKAPVLQPGSRQGGP